MSASLRKRIERMERIVEAARRGSDEDSDRGEMRLIGEILVAGRDRIVQQIRAGRPPVPHTPESLEELGRRGWEQRQQMEAYERHRRILNAKRR